MNRNLQRSPLTPIRSSVDEMDEVLGEFLVESYENLDRLDQDLVALEDDPSNKVLLSGIFRTIHTIKGTCGFLGFSKLEALTHAGENLLSRLRDGELLLDPQITSALLATVDAVRQMLAEIESTSTEGSGDYSQLTGQLHALLDPTQAQVAEPPAQNQVDPTQAQVAEPPAQNQVDPTQAQVAEPPAQNQVAPTQAQVAEPPTQHETPAPPVAQQQDSAGPPVAQQQDSAGQVTTESNIRVDVSLLDTLMNLVGELVLARNQIIQVTASYGENDLAAAAQRLNLITSELQEGVMRTRMQPIGNVLSKFSRVVRDIAVSLDKQARIEIEGKETELDKTINEAIKDPLTHLVRNSVDHGLEMPDVRIAKGKNPEGRVLLRAYHEGGQVNIEIQDDGAGIDQEVIKRKAVEKGLITQTDADRMSDREALQLIFLPGFSTAAQVSNISGRGVGMDVVKTNIEAIGGTVEVHTEIGEGTTFKIKIPLTLAIIPALLVTTNGDRYAIPQVGLVELLRLERKQAQTAIENIHGAPVLRLRGKLLPLCHLGEELAEQETVAWSGPNSDTEVVNIVVLQADGRQFGLVVDEIRDTQEIVVKPLDQQLKAISAFAGATIMGDGRIALILDVMGIALKTRVIGEFRERAVAEALEDDVDRLVVPSETLLLVEAGERRVAVPLALVSRLEEFDPDQIEQANGLDAVQYRGRIMRLVNLAEELGATRSALSPADPSNVIVFTSNERSLGLVVDQIIDIIEQPVIPDNSAPGAIVRSSAVIDGKITDIIDVVELVHAIENHFFVETESISEAGAR